ncbi:Abi family protein [Lactobacillus helveticus]|uniref:Abi family protein n=1 Tax=Lactobacillus helveticus TaxID=1587 RepID=UPI0021C49B7E|nr:Abi family protein [Lactobacillus helveticus]MCP9317507.1 Abi family protein [Lactobacillus helveticus]MDH5818201.1 Abi family protein [Lactobacillus helveticus]
MDNHIVDKPFKTTEQQIAILESRHLLFYDKETAAKNLERYGYYEIINGYKDNFMINPSNDEKGFKDNVSFDHIYQLFMIDQRLRAATIESLEYFESTLRQAVAYTVSKNISYKQSDYIDRRKYNHGPRFRHSNPYNYPVDKLMHTLTKITNRNDQPFKHYREDHGNVPPWVVVKRLSFGNLIWWTKLLKNRDKTEVISKTMGLPIEIVQGSEEVREIFGDFLSLLLDYRNIAAHGGRIYNHFSRRHMLSYRGPLYARYFKVTQEDYNAGKGQSRLGVLLRGLDLFENKEPYITLLVNIELAIKGYLKLYPQDEQYLLDTMEIDMNIFNNKD